MRVVNGGGVVHFMQGLFLCSNWKMGDEVSICIFHRLHKDG
jgi:hypothetical protein